MTTFKVGDIVRVNSRYPSYQGRDLFIMRRHHNDNGWWVAYKPKGPALTWFEDENLILGNNRDYLESVITECEKALADARRALDEFDNPIPKVGDRYQKSGTDIFRVVFIYGDNCSYVNERNDHLGSAHLSIWDTFGYTRVPN